MIDYDLLYQTLIAKVNEGITVLQKTDIGDKVYEQTLSDLVTTAKLVKTFGDIVPQQEQPREGIKNGDTYVSFDGSSKGNKIVIFTSNGCSYCEAMKPVYLPFLENTNLIVENINISDETYKDFIKDLGIHGVPTYLLVKDSTVLHRFEGYDVKGTPEENLNRLNKLLNKYF